MSVIVAKDIAFQISHIVNLLIYLNFLESIIFKRKWKCRLKEKDRTAPRKGNMELWSSLSTYCSHYTRLFAIYCVILHCEKCKWTKHDRFLVYMSSFDPKTYSTTSIDYCSVKYKYYYHNYHVLMWILVKVL